MCVRVSVHEQQSVRTHVSSTSGDVNVGHLDGSSGSTHQQHLPAAPSGRRVRFLSTFAVVELLLWRLQVMSNNLNIPAYFCKLQQTFAKKLFSCVGWFAPIRRPGDGENPTCLIQVSSQQRPSLSRSGSGRSAAPRLRLLLEGRVWQLQTPAGCSSAPSSSVPAPSAVENNGSM